MKGRKRKSGERFPGGQLRPSFDRGTERVQALRQRFSAFEGGKGGDHVGDPIGRAWIVGLLENPYVDPAALRDAGRQYAARYWGYWPATVGVGNYLAETRKGGGFGDGEDPRGETFRRLDRLLVDAGSAAHDAVQSLCLDRYWLPDDDPPWVARLINKRMIQSRQPVAGQLPVDADWRHLAAAIEGLLALAGDPSMAPRKGGTKRAA